MTKTSLAMVVTKTR